MRAVVLAGLLAAAGCGGATIEIPRTTAPATIHVTGDFADGTPIPRQYTCAGTGISPPLHWSGVPPQADSVAIVVTDPDATVDHKSGTFIHWVVYHLPAGDGGIGSGQLPGTAYQAHNSAGKAGWYRPCPPAGTHHYVFTVYAVRGTIEGTTTVAVLTELARQAVATGTLTGTVTTH